MEPRADGRLLLKLSPARVYEVNGRTPLADGLLRIRRAGITPPDALLSTIWPELDKWKGRFGPQPHQINDLAAAGVTNLLFYLREVILQDSVALRKMFPSHPVWSHPIFQHKAYKAFARELEPYL